MRRYSENHEWVEEGTVGISREAREELGEIVYVELPEVGRQVQAGDELAVLESTKAAVDFYAPVSGTVVAVNEALRESTDPLNQSPEEQGWLVRLELSAPSELERLMSRPDYQDLLSQ